MANKDDDLTQAQRTALRTGTCEAVACRDRCESFAYNRTMDSFRICICGHTQQSHARGKS